MDAHLRDDGDVATVLAASELLFDLALLAQRDFDAIDNLIHLGVSQANVRQIVAQPDSDLRYAFAETNPPDELRRPISVAALGRVLNLPFETVRRRAVRLCEIGALVATPEGLVAPSMMLGTSRHVEMLQAVHAATARTFERLCEQGFFRAGDLPPPLQVPREAPLRAVGRLVGDFYLRMLEPLSAWAGDPIDAVIFLSLLSRNRDAQPRPGVGRVHLGVPAQIARAFQFSPETVRRRLQRMTDRQICSKEPDGGFVASVHAISGPLRDRLAEPSALNLRRLYRRLSEVGAIDIDGSDANRSPNGHYVWAN